MKLVTDVQTNDREAMCQPAYTSDIKTEYQWLIRRQMDIANLDNEVASHSGQECEEFGFQTKSKHNTW